MKKLTKTGKYAVIVIVEIAVWLIFVYPNFANLVEHQFYLGKYISKSHIVSAIFESFVYPGTFMLSLAPFVFIGYIVHITTNAKPQIRDLSYLQNMLSSTNKRLPIATMKQLIEEVAGEGFLDDSDVKEILQRNITPITDWIKNDNRHDTLLVRGEWGSGKTTSVLIALSQANQDTHRYIYESAFKYSQNVPDFTQGIIKALCGILEEFNIDTDDYANTLIDNINLDMKQDANNIIKLISKQCDITLTSEVIHKLNQAYHDSGCNSTVFIIIDDIDRLQGNEILSVLSFLSILRRLYFVRVIVPASTAAITDQLAHEKVYQPEKFIKKYLTNQSSVDIDSSEILAKKILELKLRKLQVKKLPKNLDFSGAWNAFIIKFVADKIGKNSERYAWQYCASFPWIDKSTIDIRTGEDTQYWQIPKQIDSDTQLIINKARRKLSDEMFRYKIPRKPPTTATEMQRTLYTNKEQPLFVWPACGATSILHFEDIITAPRISNEFGAESNPPALVRVTSRFTNDYYQRLVDSWVPRFGSTYWDLLGVTIRDMVDILEHHEKELTTLSQGNLAKQFAQTFNALFPKSKYSIIIDNETKTTKGSQS